MKKLKLMDIYILWSLLVLYAVCLFVGVVIGSIYVFVIGVIFIIIYYIYEKSHLVCPNCGAPESLFCVTQAVKKRVYCYSCGKEIYIQKGRFNNENS